MDDGQILRLGDADWEVVRMPGHTPGHLWLWQERLLVVGDALSDYGIGWVNLALGGPRASAAALASLHRLADLARVLLPADGADPCRLQCSVHCRSAPRPASSTIQPGRCGTPRAGSSRSP
jgi:glyoxylase-like metal-dependent hydrolase (beta-lactamase superfamily II)